VNDLISEYFLTEEGMIQINDPEIKAVFLWYILTLLTMIDSVFNSQKHNNDHLRIDEKSAIFHSWLTLIQATSHSTLNFVKVQ
jgi:hypothetical protein